MNGNILIIDSGKERLKKLRELLSKEGFSLITVTDKAAAESICEKMDIEYIIANPQSFELKSKENKNSILD
jgi:PleD family two-component response regulator